MAVGKGLIFLEIDRLPSLLPLFEVEWPDFPLDFEQIDEFLYHHWGRHMYIEGRYSSKAGGFFQMWCSPTAKSNEFHLETYSSILAYYCMFFLFFFTRSFWCLGNGAPCPPKNSNGPGTFKASERPQSHRLPVTTTRGARRWIIGGSEKCEKVSWLKRPGEEEVFIPRLLVLCRCKFIKWN